MNFATPVFHSRQHCWQWLALAVVLSATVIALIWLALGLRSREMVRRIGRRLADRERMARELHDTLLQGFQGLTMRFQSVAEQVPSTAPARRLLDQALDRAEEVLIEGRDRARMLDVVDGSGELAHLIEAAAYRLRNDPGVVVKMVAEGDCGAIVPSVNDELLAIASEVLESIFKCSHRNRVQIGLVCGPLGVRLSIFDEWTGNDPSDVETAERPDPSELAATRERARRIKARLLVREGAAGAEILIVMSSRAAYASWYQRSRLFSRRRRPSRERGG